MSHIPAMASKIELWALDQRESHLATSRPTRTTPAPTLTIRLPASRRPDTDLLASELAELVGDFDLGMMGFDDAELQKILSASDESDDESAPDKAEEGHNNTDDPVPEPGRPTPSPRCILFHGLETMPGCLLNLNLTPACLLR